MTKKSNKTLFSFFEECIVRLSVMGRSRTAENYKVTFNSFRRFRGDVDMVISSLNAGMIESYACELRQTGLKRNTISAYMRVLRAVYNRAVASGYVKNPGRPFRNVYTGIDRTEKRAIPLDAMKRVWRFDLSSNPVAEFARDMFMLSFYLRGISFIDMALLRPSDLHDGFLCYCRRKTGQWLRIQWESPMQRIIERYGNNAGRFMLPIIPPGTKGGDSVALREANNRLNYHLKIIGRRLGLVIPLTMYVARHSWASIARSKNVPLSVISEGMGHDSEATTMIYLASLDSSAVDRANAMMLSLLK